MKMRGYLLLIGALMLVLVVVEGTRPRPLDLTVRLEREGDAPFDAEVFYQSLPAWLGQPVEPVAVTPFERLADTSATGQTYLFLNRSFTPDAEEANRLLDFAARGNTVFVAALDLRGAFSDSLARPPSGGLAEGVRTEPSFSDISPFEVGRNTAGLLTGQLDPDSLMLVSPGAQKSYRLPVRSVRWHLAGLDSARTEVLGTRRDAREVTLARVRWGRGEVVLSSTPLAFSNAALTGDGDGAAYVAAVLAALPDQPVWWDDHHKVAQENAQTAATLRARDAPRYGGRTGFCWPRASCTSPSGRGAGSGAIPVVAPPPNAQREFARTVGRLHFVHRDDRRLAQRQARHVLDRVRNRAGRRRPRT